MQHLKRELGLFDIMIYALGSIIGAGIYVLIGKAAGITGNSVWLSFIFAAIIAALTGLTYAELSSAYPVDSAEYRYSRIAFKDKRFSFMVGWIKAFVMITAAAAVSIGFGGYLSKLTGWSPDICAACLIVCVVALLMIGLKNALWVDLGLVTMTLIGLLIIIVSGSSHITAKTSFDITMGWSGVVSAAALIFFAYLGFEHIANISGEVKNPKKNLPLGFLLSIGICTLLYVLVSLVSTNVLPWQDLASSTAPLADVVESLLGENWSILLILMALCATSSTVLASVAAGSRMFFGLAEEKSFPNIFSRLTSKGSPIFAVIAVGFIAILFSLTGSITTLASFVNFGALFLFIVINITLIRIRFSHPHISGGFRVPLNIGWFPVLPAIAAVSCLWFLSTFSKTVFVVFILFAFLGLSIYVLFWERKHEHHVANNGEKFSAEPVKKREILAAPAKEAHHAQHWTQNPTPHVHAPVKIQRSRKVKKRR